MSNRAKNAHIGFCRKKSHFVFGNMQIFGVITYINCRLRCRICFNYIDKAKGLCYNVRCRKVYCRRAVIPSRNFPLFDFR